MSSRSWSGVIWFIYGNILLTTVRLITWWLSEKQTPVAMRIIQGNVLSIFIVSCLWISSSTPLFLVFVDEANTDRFVSMNAKCKWPRYSDNKVIKIKVNIKRDCAETCCIAERSFTVLALHLQTQYDLGRTNSQNKAWVIHYFWMLDPVCQSSAP